MTAQQDNMQDQQRPVACEQLLDDGQQVGTPLSDHPSTAYKSMRKPFIALVAAQVALVGILGIPHINTLLTGKHVLVSVHPVDPVDVFRGEYADLGYDIADVDTHGFNADDPVYVVLKQNRSTGIWKANGAFHKMPPAKSGEVVIKGRVKESRTMFSSTGSTSVQYGIERLYMPEHKSSGIWNSKDVRMELCVAADGTPEIYRAYTGKQCFYDGSSWLNPYR